MPVLIAELTSLSEIKQMKKIFFHISFFLSIIQTGGLTEKSSAYFRWFTFVVRSVVRGFFLDFRLLVEECN